MSVAFHSYITLKDKDSGAKNVDFVAVLRSSVILQSIFTCNMAMESYWYVDFASFINFQIYHFLANFHL